MVWSLKRTRQCAKCPWKTSVDPNDIPGGYSRERHENLAGTIATPGEIPDPDEPRHVMACHEHAAQEEVHCVGWLHHQLNQGNNIGLRLALLDCENAHHIRVDGPQHACFSDTLPGSGTQNSEDPPDARTDRPPRNIA